jgi:hypothetical protein
MKKVFIGNLPGEATLVELYAFLEGVRLSAELDHMKGVDNDRRDYHYFVAKVNGENDARDVIEKFNGREFAGRKIQAREYIERSNSNTWTEEERRLNNCSDNPNPA